MKEPKIVSGEEMNLMGIVYFGDGKDQGIEEIYTHLKKNVTSMSNRKNSNKFYGVCFRDPDFTSETGKFNYMIAAQVPDINEIPLEMAAKKIPSHDYAVFRSREASYDSIDPVVQELWSYAYEWVSRNKVKTNRFYDFECYTEDMEGNLRFMEVYIPVIM
jgi:predicted transcriptional regulator YdeE